MNHYLGTVTVCVSVLTFVPAIVHVHEMQKVTVKDKRNKQLVALKCVAVKQLLLF
jgi:hypothetical protein